MQIQLTTIRFPEIQLATRDAHKLRGYFGNLFKEHSPLLHNHFENGTFRYQYPLVQYKVIHQTPVLLGINEGGQLLVNLFLDIHEIKLNDQVFPVYQKNIDNRHVTIGVNEELYHYRFETLWMGLNQDNFRKYARLEEDDKKPFLQKILIGNILSFFKSLDFRIDQKILINSGLAEKQTQFKNKQMLAFTGDFYSNALLPSMVGLGKAVSRGFGTINQQK